MPNHKGDTLQRAMEMAEELKIIFSKTLEDSLLKKIYERKD